MLDAGVNLSKIYKIIFLLPLIIFAPSINNAYGQSLVEDIGSPIAYGDSAEMFTETIQIIGRSQKIFILTNSNQMLNKGDFITLVLNQKEPVARALVGKTHDGLAGIKILKIYSLKRWALMRQGLNAQIIKGDDSKLFVDPKKPEEEQPQIESEEDLYSLEGEIEGDLEFLNKDLRHIKPDNLVGGSYSQFSFEHDLQPDPQTESHAQLAFSWAYQFSDNYWVEGLYGRTMINDFPAKSKQTLINNFTVRLKYTFKAPLYSYIMPYIGFQLYNVSSPDAGVGTDPTQNQKEEDVVAQLEEDGPAVGVTLLRRLVPGWFIRADLGNDIMSLGFAIEF